MRAWSGDFEQRGADGRSAPGLWVCCKGCALYMQAGHASSHAEAHARSWRTGDGVLVHFTAELLAGCREHREPRTAVKLFNNVMTSAWARMPCMRVSVRARRASAVRGRGVIVWSSGAQKESAPTQHKQTNKAGAAACTGHAGSATLGRRGHSKASTLVTLDYSTR